MNRHVLDAVRPVHADLAALTVRVGGSEVRGESLADLRRQLSRTFYERLHTGGHVPSSPSELADEEFEERLRAVVPHRATAVPASVVTLSGGLVVEIGGVRVRLPTSSVDGVVPGQDILVHGEPVRPRLSPGFLLVDGSLGHGLAEGPVLRVYVHLRTADAASAVLAAVLRFLEGQSVPYRAKVLSMRTGLPRRDAAVVYLGPRAWHAVAGIAASVDGVPGIGTEVSPYTHRLGPGVSMAWEPDDPRPGCRGLSFGEHRSFATSSAVLAHAEKGANSIEKALAEQFSAANIDYREPFRNANSPNTPY